MKTQVAISSIFGSYGIAAQSRLAITPPPSSNALKHSRLQSETVVSALIVRFDPAVGAHFYLRQSVEKSNQSISNL